MGTLVGPVVPGGDHHVKQKLICFRSSHNNFSVFDPGVYDKKIFEENAGFEDYLSFQLRNKGRIRMESLNSQGIISLILHTKYEWNWTGRLAVEYVYVSTGNMEDAKTPVMRSPFTWLLFTGV